MCFFFRKGWPYKQAARLSVVQTGFFALRSSSSSSSSIMEELARWDHEHIAGLLETCTGAQWLRVARIIRENEVHGRDLAAHIEPDNPGKLVTFFLEDFGESITKFIAKQFVSKLIQASSAGRKEGKRPANDQRESRGQLPDDTPQVGAADGGGTGTARVPTCILNVDFNASAAESAHVSSRRLMVEVPISASVALVKRRLLDALHLPLFSSLKLVKSGVELKDTEDSVRPNWPSFSFVHAILLPAVIPLSSDNLGTHACVVQHVALSQKSMATAMSDTNTLSNNLVLFINEGTNPLGNGAAGVTYKGSVIDKANPNEKITVAVKRFFILENPKFYGLSKAADVAAWADRELYSEINTLLSLSHPSVVRLRCVGLLSIYDKPFPAYIAMDFCNAGSLDQWIKEKRVSALQLVPFLQQFVDAMTYLHVDMKIVHRDIKPDNVFLHKRAPDAQPVLVVGDVRHSHLPHRRCVFSSMFLVHVSYCFVRCDHRSIIRSGSRSTSRRPWPKCLQVGQLRIWLRKYHFLETESVLWRLMCELRHRGHDASKWDNLLCAPFLLQLICTFVCHVCGRADFLCRLSWSRWYAWSLRGLASKAEMTPRVAVA